MKHIALLLSASAVAFSSLDARADVKLPAVFSDHMVVQSEREVAVWGWAESGEGVVVSVYSNSVTEPAAVRYGLAANPRCNLINAAELPASPFRTDDWK